MKKKLRKAADKIVMEVFRLFVYFASIAYLTTEGANLKWVGATYKFFTQAVFSIIERAPIAWLSDGMRTIETFVMWFLEKFSFQEVGLLVCAALASRLAVRLVVEADRMYNRARARVMRKRRQQAKQQAKVNETAEAKFYASNAVSMTDITPNA